VARRQTQVRRRSHGLTAGPDDLARPLTRIEAPFRQLSAPLPPICRVGIRHIGTNRPSATKMGSERATESSSGPYDPSPISSKTAPLALPLLRLVMHGQQDHSWSFLPGEATNGHGLGDQPLLSQKRSKSAPRATLPRAT